MAPDGNAAGLDPCSDRLRALLLPLGRATASDLWLRRKEHRGLG